MKPIDVRVFTLNRHRNVKITQDVYAHLAPQAWKQGYGGVSFHVPSEPAKIYELRRDDDGKIVGRLPAIIAATVPAAG